MNKLYFLWVLTILTINIFAQTAPTASNVTILGSAYYNSSTSDVSTITGDYDFEDTDGDAEATSNYLWYRSLNSDGTGLVSTGITTKRYTVQAADDGYYLYFEVEPVDDSPQTGTSVTSSAITVNTTTTIPDYEMPKNQTYFPTNGTEHIDVTSETGGADGLSVNGGITYTIYGDLDLTNVNSGFNLSVNGILIVYGQLITNNNVNITVNGGATFEVRSGLDAKNNSVLNINGTVDITGDAAFEGNTTITVNGGAGLNVDGGLDIGDNANVTVNGDIAVTGNLDTGSGSTITINGGGSVDVGGDLIGDAEILGDGPITVAGSVDPNIQDTGGNQLPIELTSFNVTHSENSVIVTWQTATEEKNDYFTLERSVDGINYKTIATIKGAGYSYTTLNYSYTDNKPLQGVSYYRLTQTDYDGTFETFNPISVSYLNEASLAIGPNPVQNFLNINMGSDIGETILNIYNIAGSLVKTIDIQNDYAKVDISNIPSGSYMIILKAGEVVRSRRIIKE